MAKKEKKELKKPSQEWLTTYGDMITLCLCFFVMLYNPTEVDTVQLATLTASLQSSSTTGGQSLSTGRMADLGNTINSLPSMEKGKSLGLVAKRAVSLFAPDIKSKHVTMTNDERGLVITLASNAYFQTNSAELNMDEHRETLLRVAQFLSSQELAGRYFRIEGHTSSEEGGPDSMWPSNWELSTTRATNILHYLSDFGVDERQFSVAGYAGNHPKVYGSSPESNADNRHIDIIILDEGHF